MNNKENLSPKTLEVFAAEEETGRPLAFTMDPVRTHRERLRLIVKAQIDRIDPKAFYYNIGGVYDLVPSSELAGMRNREKREIDRYVEELITEFKGPYTSDIIFGDSPIE